MAKAYKFDSGLTLFYEKNNINKSTVLEVSFDCGNRCNGELSGLAHFCEHMFFTGTDKLNKAEVFQKYFDFMKVNAFTTDDIIQFCGTIVTEELPQYLAMVQDMICNSTCTKEAVDEERKVIVQEIARSASNHNRHASRFKDYELYKMEHLIYSGLGIEEDLNKITSKDIKKFIKKYFVKNNCYISICTPLSFNNVKSIIKKNFDDLMPSSNLKPLPFMEDKLIEDENVKIKNAEVDKNFFYMDFKTNRKGPDLKYRVMLNMITGMLARDEEMGLKKRLRLDNGLIYGIGVGASLNKENTCLELSTEISSQNIKPCIDVISGCINEFVEKGFSDKIFKDTLRRHRFDIQTRVEHPEGLKNRLLRYREYGRFVTEEEIDSIYESITLEELNEAMKELFKNAKIQVLIYGNAEKKDVYTIGQVKKKFECLQTK